MSNNDDPLDDTALVSAAPRGRGRPAFVPTEKERRQVKALTGMGLRMPEIAVIIGITTPTLRKHFKRELATGSLEANAKVAQSLFKAATDPLKPNVIAGIFWMKVRAGWRDHDLREDEPGKKQQLMDAAESVRDRFSPSAPPKLKVVK